MMSTIEDLSILLQSLPNSNDTVLTLAELDTALATVSPLVLASFVPHLNFDNLFQCLYNSSGTQLESCCSVLSKFLNAVNPSVILGNFNKELLDGLKSENAHIKNLSLGQIERVAKDDGQHFSNHRNLLELIVSQLQSDLPGIAGKAHNVLVKIGETNAGVSLIFNNQFLSIFNQVASSNDIVKFRVYEVIIEIVTKSADSLKYFSIHDNTDELNFIQRLIGEIFENDKDILVQLNAIEIASKFAMSPHGFNYLESLNVDSKLQNQLQKSSNDPLGKFLIPGLLKFFGSLCFIQPSLINLKYRQFCDLVFESILSKDPSNLHISVETIGLIGSSVSGKIALSRTDNKFESCLPILGELISEPPTELRIITLHSLNQLLYIPLEEQLSDVISLVQSWFYKISSKDLVAQIISISSQPFLALKIAAFSVLKALANLTWGQKALKNCPTFEEYLLDRRTETTKEGLHIKFDIVQTLIQTGTAANIFGDPYWLRLLNYERDGRFYVSSETVVAFEGDN